MKKLIFFFLISYIITQTINDYQTKPYYDFDWTDEDSYDFELTFTQSVPNDVKIVLAKNTVTIKYAMLVENITRFHLVLMC